LHPPRSAHRRGRPLGRHAAGPMTGRLRASRHAPRCLARRGVARHTLAGWPIPGGPFPGGPIHRAATAPAARHLTPSHNRGGPADVRT
jgi:hypothetical protein